MNGSASADDLRLTAEAWESFTAGDDSVAGVRPEILTSWYRCREEYGVDPGLDRAPAAAPEETAHSIERDVVFAELGGLATNAAREVAGLDGLVTVTDPGGRILACWGSQRLLRHGKDSNLAPWSTWSEWASGTNGMGTSLECRHPVMVRGPEHWCQAFHSWVCAGVAVRDVVTHDPLAVLNISCWRTELPGTVLPWLRGAATATEAKLRQRARHTGVLLAAAFADARVAPATPLAVVDTAGNVVLANAEAAALLGTPADVPAYAPTHRWAPQLSTLPRLVRRAVERAGQDPQWTGSTRIFAPFLDTAIPVSVRPVSAGNQVIGLLLGLGSPGGHPPFGDRSDDSVLGATLGRALPSRVIAMRDERWVILDPREIRFAEADRNTVWLKTDQGVLRAATRGLDRLEQQLEGKGFLRVHRRFLCQRRPGQGDRTGLQGNPAAHHRRAQPRNRSGRPAARVATAPDARPLAPGSAEPAQIIGDGNQDGVDAVLRPVPPGRVAVLERAQFLPPRRGDISRIPLLLAAGALQDHGVGHVSSGTSSPVHTKRV